MNIIGTVIQTSGLHSVVRVSLWVSEDSAGDTQKYYAGGVELKKNIRINNSI
jgi:hypothetical protein